jgi:carboxypeptidase C (cathepsin A)
MLTGESFGGKYLSYMSKAILDYNSQKPPDSSQVINLKSLIVSNPLVDVPTERMH